MKRYQKAMRVYQLVQLKRANAEKTSNIQSASTVTASGSAVPQNSTNKMASSNLASFVGGPIRSNHQSSDALLVQLLQDASRNGVSGSDPYFPPGFNSQACAGELLSQLLFAQREPSRNHSNQALFSDHLSLQGIHSPLSAFQATVQDTGRSSVAVKSQNVNTDLLAEPYHLESRNQTFPSTQDITLDRGLLHKALDARLFYSLVYPDPFTSYSWLQSNPAPHVGLSAAQLSRLASNRLMAPSTHISNDISLSLHSLLQSQNGVQHFGRTQPQQSSPYDQVNGNLTNQLSGAQQEQRLLLLQQLLEPASIPP
jgi:hypothetical protein